MQLDIKSGRLRHGVSKPCRFQSSVSAIRYKVPPDGLTGIDLTSYSFQSSVSAIRYKDKRKIFQYQELFLSFQSSVSAIRYKATTGDPDGLNSYDDCFNPQ